MLFHKTETLKESTDCDRSKFDYSDKSKQN